MPTNTALSTHKFANSLPSNPVSHNIRQLVAKLKTRAGRRYAKVAGVSFAATLPVLGIVDPRVLLASGQADVHSVERLASHAEAALRNMAVMELFATGGVAVLVLAAMAAAGYLRTRYKAARQEELAVE